MKKQITKEIEETIVRLFIAMCIESLNPELFDVLVDKIVPYLVVSRHLDIEGIFGIKE